MRERLCSPGIGYGPLKLLSLEVGRGEKTDAIRMGPQDTSECVGIIFSIVHGWCSFVITSACYISITFMGKMFRVLFT